MIEDGPVIGDSNSVDRNCRRFAQLAAIAVFVVGLIFISAIPLDGHAQGVTNPGRAAKKSKDKKQKIEPPKLIESVEAEYTDRAVKERVEGAVKLKLQIDKQGNVSDVKVIDGLGHGLDKEAVKAAKQFEFEAATKNGEPIPVNLPFRVRFNLPPIPAVFKGRIVDANSGEPISDARIAISYLGKKYDPAPNAVSGTDEKGAFVFEQVPPGQYRVEISADGYMARDKDLRFKEDQTVEVELQLRKQPVKFSGTILEAGSKKPLPGIEVVVSKRGSSDLEATALTDEDGQFGFRGLAKGEYSVTIDASGYEKFRIDEKIPSNERLSVAYYLQPEYYTDYSVSTRVEPETRSIDKKKVSLEEVRRIPGTGGDITRVVQNLPGVARPSFLSGQIVVRGASPSATKTFIRGDEVPFIYHFFGGPSVVSTEMVDSVDFYPGNFSARYGRALGGVLDLQTRKPRSDRLHAFSEVDLLDATAQVEGPVTEDVSVALSARRSYIGTVFPALVPEDTFQVTAAPRYYDYQGWLNWDVSEDHTLELLVYGSDDQIELLFDDEDPVGNTQTRFTGLNFANGFERGQLRWEWRPDAPYENTFMASFGVNTVSFRASDSLFFDLRYDQFQFRDDFTWNLADKLTLNLGLDIQAGETTYSFEVPRFGDEARGNSQQQGGPPANFASRGQIGSRDKPIYRPAAYTEIEYEPFERLELIPGFRVDYYGDVDGFSYAPRMKARFDVTDTLLAKGGVGVFTQPPNPGQTEPDFGNPNLTFEKATHYSVGGEWKPLQYLQFEATGFYRDLNDLIQQTNDRTRDSETGEVQSQVNDNSGVGRSYGLELLARHYPKDKFFGWVAYTLSRSERLDDESGDYVPFEYDQTHNLTAVAGYELPYDFSLSARFQLVTGNPYTPVTGGVFNADQNEYEPVYGRQNSRRSKPFHQLDVRVDKKWVFDTWVLGGYLDVINVYNATNQEGVQYNYDYSEKAPIRGLPIIPTLGLNARY